MNKNAGRIVELDTLRAVGALGVVAIHLYPQAAFWTASFAWMFFALSGFLITRLLLSAHEPPGVALRNFWARRILRIWPVYYLTFLGLLLYTGISLRYARLPDGSFEGALQAAFFLQFFEYHWLPVPKVFAENFVTYFGHSWTLAVEEQFYVLWPLLALPLMRRPGALGLICLAAIFLAIYSRYSGTAMFTLTSTLDGFAPGALIAVAERAGLLPNWQVRPLPRWTWYLLGFAVLATLPLISRYVYLGYAHPDDSHERLTVLEHVFLLAAFGIFYGCAIFAVVHLSGHPRLAILRVPAIVYLGTISYSLYMFHVPIINLYYVALGLLGISRTWLGDVLTWGTVIAAGSASYLLIERPLSRYRHRFRM